MREKEIEQILQKNPDLYRRSVHQLALFFYIQGELSSSHTRTIAEKKADFYRHRLGVLDNDLMLECDQALKDLLIPNKHLDLVGEE